MEGNRLVIVKKILLGNRKVNVRFQDEDYAIVISTGGDLKMVHNIGKIPSVSKNTNQAHYTRRMKRAEIIAGVVASSILFVVLYEFLVVSEINRVVAATIAASSSASTAILSATLFFLLHETERK